MYVSGQSVLDQLKLDLRKSNCQAYAEGSKRNLKIQWESFLCFCIYFKLKYLPVSTDTLQLYAQFLSRSFKSIEGIKNYLSGVKIMHQLLGYEVSQINDYLLNLSLKGISKNLSHIIKHACPITPDILVQIYHVLNMDSPDDITYWCLFLFAFFLLARKSNLVPTSRKDLISPKFLLSRDVLLTDEGLVINMYWSKTIQAGERVLRTPLSFIRKSVLCPVRAYMNMIKVVPRTEDSPLFLLSSKKPIFYRNFLQRVRQAVSLIGLNKEEFSTHSFRRGFATFAFRLNLPSDLIQLMGDWKSDAYKNYLQYEFSDKLKISRLISKEIRRQFEECIHT